MPKLDKTGPRGEGPKTGRGLGPCNNPQLNQEETIKKRPLGQFNRARTGKRIVPRGNR